MSNYRITRLQNYKIKWSFVLSFLLVAGGWSLAKPTWAGPFDFGGRVTAVYPCLNGIAFFLLGPLSAPHLTGTYIYNWGTPLYKWWVPPHPGQNLLGKASLGGCCFVPTPVGPICLPAQRTVIRAGTSF